MDCMRSQRISVWIPFVMSVSCDVALLWQLMTDITDPGIFIILIAAIGAASATVLNGYRYPFVRFTEDGVLVRRFFRTVKYGWQDFIQVGVARPPEKWINLSLVAGMIYMLLPGAEKHNPNEDLAGDNIRSFYWRNRLHMFLIPMEEGAEHLQYIQNHYGELDFEVTIYNRIYKNDY